MCVDKIKCLESFKKFEICQKLHLTLASSAALNISVELFKSGWPEMSVSGDPYFVLKTYYNNTICFHFTEKPFYFW